MSIDLPEINTNTNEPTGNLVTITSTALSPADIIGFDDPVNDFEAGAQLLLNRLATAINAARDVGTVNVTAATAQQVNDFGATLQISSTVRGQQLVDPANVGNLDLTVNMNQGEVPASGSEVNLIQTTGRNPKAGDEIRIRRWDEDADGGGGMEEL